MAYLNGVEGSDSTKPNDEKGNRELPNDEKEGNKSDAESENELKNRRESRHLEHDHDRPTAELARRLRRRAGGSEYLRFQFLVSLSANEFSS